MTQRRAALVQRLVRGLDITETEAIAIFSRLTPNIKLDDLTEFFANDSFSKRPAHGRTTDAAVVAEFSHVGLVNPPTSGVDVLVERFFLAPTATQIVFLVQVPIDISGLTGFGTPAFSEYRDLRMTGQPAGTMSTVTNATKLSTSSGFIVGRQITLSNTSFMWDFGDGVLLSPGTSLWAEANVVNALVSLSAQWTEFQRDT